MSNAFRCCICNQFFSPSWQFYSWTPFGNSSDLEPCDEEIAHKDCYEGLPEEGRNLIIKTSWLKPMLRKPVKEKDLV